MRNLKPTESQILAAGIKRLHHSHEVVCWRQNTGAARPEDTRAMDALIGILRREGASAAVAYLREYAKRRGQKVRFGVKGAADVTGYVTARARRLPHGARVDLEAKTDGGKLDAEQRAYLQAVRDAGGVAGVFRSIDDIEAILGGEVGELR